jgi:hypothetical protein
VASVLLLSLLCCTQVEEAVAAVLFALVVLVALQAAEEPRAGLQVLLEEHLDLLRSEQVAHP